MSKVSLWTSEEARDAAGGTLKGKRKWTASGISIDSRTLAAGDLFVALAGPSHDGHDYVAEAFARGAAAALVSRDRMDVPDDWPLLRVLDTLEALNQLAVAARERSGAKRIAVTGSVGKTGTKEMLRVALSAQGPTHASAASHNNLWGVPLTLSRMAPDTEFAVFEIGMNHAGEIRPLTSLVAPEVAIVTTVQPVHLEFFASVDAIADAKAEIFEGLVAPAIAIINGDLPQTERLVRAAEKAGAREIVTFGEKASVMARITHVEATTEGCRVTAAIGGKRVAYDLGLHGRHWAVNSAAVLAAVAAVGADVERAAQSLAAMTPLKGRGLVHEIAAGGGHIIVIDESYNANPASMAAAIRTLGARPMTDGGRRIAVLGDMLELGPKGPELHAALADELERSDVDLVFLSGPSMQHLWAKIATKRRGAYGAQSTDIRAPLLAAIKAGDAVMIKGSLGSRMGPIVDALVGLDADDKRRARGRG